MEISPESCRVCLSVTNFNVSLYGDYCRKSGMIEKILVCLQLVVKKTDNLQTICFQCAGNVEKYYDFLAFVKKSQSKLCSIEKHGPNLKDKQFPALASYAKGMVIDINATSFSFLELSRIDDKMEAEASDPFLPYFSPPTVEQKHSEPSLWKAQRPRRKEMLKMKNECDWQKIMDRPRQHSRDLFDSQSQETDEPARCLDWKLSSEENTIRRVREKCFGPSDF